MFLHLIDDARAVNHFVHRIRRNFPESHRFLVFTPTGQLKHITPEGDVTIFVPTKPGSVEVAQQLEDYEAVFVHNLGKWKSRIVLDAPRDVVFIWGVWGHDYYHVYPQLFRKLFLPYTRMANVLLGKMSLSYKYLLSRLQSVLRINFTGKLRQRAASRITYTFNTLPHHSDVFRVVPIPKERRFHLAYYSIETITEGFDQSVAELGCNILIGNSASNTSNHLDIFLKLRGHLSGQNVVVVLGYGSSRYRKLVNILGRKIFGGRYQPVNRTLPLDQYNQMLMDCNVMIFNHRRAQAIGNILFGVWAGQKIYLREENPVYAWLRDMGVRVFSIQSEWPTGEFTPLSPKWKDQNRKIITSKYSEASAVKDFRELEFELRALNLEL